jgi:ABC-type dipeptide/oligopeptide/nickel transport system permease subunit
MSKLTTTQKTVFLVSMGLVSFLFLLGFFPQLFTSLSPEQQNMSFILRSSNSINLLGCDWLGRDVWARMVYGARYSIFIGAFVSFVTLMVPLLLASFLMWCDVKWLDQVYVFILDIFLAFPPLLLAILVTASFPKGGVWSVVIALVLGGWAANGRVVRTLMKEIASKEYVISARAIGASELRIFYRHILPNMLSPLLILWSFRVGGMILAESTLSFLGLGGDGLLSWGGMVNGGRLYISSSWIVSLAPATMIALAVFSFQGLGESLEKIFGIRKAGAINLN